MTWEGLPGVGGGYDEALEENRLLTFVACLRAIVRVIERVLPSHRDTYTGVPGVPSCLTDLSVQKRAHIAVAGTEVKSHSSMIDWLHKLKRGEGSHRTPASMLKKGNWPVFELYLRPTGISILQHTPSDGNVRSTKPPSS